VIGSTQDALFEISVLSQSHSAVFLGLPSARVGECREHSKIIPGARFPRCRAAPPRFPHRSVRGAADLHRTKRPSSPPRAAFSVSY
jgi:hypothetical protein